MKRINNKLNKIYYKYFYYFKFKYWKYHLIRFVSWLVGGFPVVIKYEGDSDPKGVTMTSFFHYKPYKNTIVINWSTREKKLGNESSNY